MTNSFSSSPQMVRYGGKVDKSGLLFNFKQTDPKTNQPKSVKIRIVSQNQWTVEIWQSRSGKEQVVETYTFTRAA